MMRTRPLLGLVCGVMLGCSPSAPSKGEGSGDSSGGGDGGLGHSETGGGPGPTPTGAQPTGDDPTGDPTPVTSTGPVGTTSGGSSSGDVDDTGGQTTCDPDPAPDTECNFLCDPDPHDDQCGVVACDPFAQDCPDGQKCAAFADDGGSAWNANKCVAITGDGAPGDPCTVEGDGLSGIDDCAEGVMCWNVDANSTGTCVALCLGLEEAPQCPGDITCQIFNNAVLNLCLPPCDPLVQDCKANEVCIPLQDGFVCVLDNSGAEGQAHDPCEFADACDPGLICVDSLVGSSACDQAVIGCCEPFCEFPDGACPAADQVCFQWFDPAALPMDDPKLAIGVCVLPQ